MFQKVWQLVIWHLIHPMQGTQMLPPLHSTNLTIRLRSFTMITAFMYGMCETSKKWANHIPLYSIQLAFGAWRPTPFWGTVKNLSYLQDLLLHVVPMIRYAFGIWAVKWQTIQFTSKLSTRKHAGHSTRASMIRENALVNNGVCFSKTRLSTRTSIKLC